VSILTPLPETPSSSAVERQSLVRCPECGRAAEITDRFTLAGSPDPVAHVRIECAAGHWFTEPSYRLGVR
jgi:hypothetical protein